MFYVAYTEDGVTDLTKRPVTFVYNGGPGSATIWLHMGSFGPMRVDTTNAQPTPPAPYTVGENSESLLDKSDLVFIDAMGTGYSRIVGKGEPKDFYGTDPDVAAFAQFIERYVGANGRWNSPKFLLGESYGTTRSAALLNALQNAGHGVQRRDPRVVVPERVRRLQRAAVRRRSSVRALPADDGRDGVVPQAAGSDAGRTSPPGSNEARQFALGDYAHALAQGSHLSPADRDAIVAKLHRFTSMPEAMIRNADLRIAPDRFEKELLRGERRTVGRLDARFTGIDHDAAGESPEFDAADAAVSAAFVAAFNGYVRGELKFESEDLYKPTNYPEVGRNWDDHHRVDGGTWDMPDVAADLRAAMSKNPT